MLNEIFKGMDNASEAINDNFNNLEPERGQNEHGSYIKYPDGRLECKAVLTFDNNISTRFGELYRTYSQVWTFPVNFSDIPLITGWVVTGNYKWIVKGGSATNKSIGIAIAGAEVDYSSPYEAIVEAKGRWKE